MAKKRANKYEKKLNINASFDDAMRALLGVSPKEEVSHQVHLEYLNLTEGDFILTKTNPIYPPEDGNISSKTFNTILISGRANTPFYIKLNVLGYTTGLLITPDIITQKFIQAIPIKEPLLISFQIDKVNLDDYSFCEVKFHLTIYQ